MQPQMQPLYDTFRFCKGKNATPNATPSATPTRFFYPFTSTKTPIPAIRIPERAYSSVRKPFKYG